MALELWSIENVAFSRLIRPSSMRSTYWTYFGFPADDQNRILTRRKIVCTLCNAAIAYNRNTTNLKVHLSTRHPELDLSIQPKLKRVRYVYQPADEDSDYPEEEVGSSSGAKRQLTDDNDVGSVTSDLGTDFLIETDTDELRKQERLLMEKDVEESVGYNVEYVDEAVDLEEVVDVDSQSSSGISIEVIEMNNIEADNDLNQKDEAFVNIFISSMNTDLAEGNELRKFCSLLNYVVPEQREIETKLRQLFAKRKVKSIASIKSALTTHKYYSLSFDKWSNVNEESYITVSIFYSNQHSSLNASVLFTVDAFTEPDNWKTLFNDINPEFCSAVIVNFDTSEITNLSEWISKYAIPVIPCFVWIIERTAQRCLAEEEVIQTMDAARQCLSTDAARECLLVYETQPPKVHPQFWYSSYKYLEFVSNFCTQSFDDNNEPLTDLLVRVRSVLNVLSPLKIVLNTLYTEAKPIASLVQPILQQLVKGYYVFCDNDSDFVSQFKSIVHEEIGSVLDEHRLILLSAFLDPRFQSLIPIEDIPSIKMEIQRKVECLEETGNGTEKLNVDYKSNVSSNTSSLSSFLGKPVAKLNSKNPRLSRLQVEMFGYAEEVEVDMEQCPTEWWQQVGARSYPNMWTVAARLSCVPAAIGVKRTSLSDRIAFHKKRRLLTDDTKRNDQMVWLCADYNLRV